MIRECETKRRRKYLMPLIFCGESFINVLCLPKETLANRRIIVISLSRGSLVAQSRRGFAILLFSPELVIFFIKMAHFSPPGENSQGPRGKKFFWTAPFRPKKTVLADAHLLARQKSGSEEVLIYSGAAMRRQRRKNERSRKS